MRRHRGLWITLAVIVVLLIAGRLALPAIIEKIVAGKLETMPGGYQGTVEDVDVRLWAGEIGMRGFTTTKKNGAIPVPFMRMREFVLATVRDGYKLRTVLRFLEPDASFVDAESEAKKQLGPKHTIENLRKQLPLELLRVEVENGTFHFRNYQTKPDVDVYARELNVVWDKLVGCLPPGSQSCRSELEGRAKVMNSGTLTFKGRFDRKPKNELHIDARLRDLRASELNPVLREYAKVKMVKGRIELDARYDHVGDRKDAMILPMLDEIDVEQAESKAKSFFSELGVGAAAGWFERKRGEKGIAFHSKPSGETDFEIIDRPRAKSADRD